MQRPLFLAESILHSVEPSDPGSHPMGVDTGGCDFELETIT